MEQVTTSLKRFCGFYHFMFSLIPQVGPMVLSYLPFPSLLLPPLPLCPPPPPHQLSVELIPVRAVRFLSMWGLSY